jgi:phosphatidylserine synthase
MTDLSNVKARLHRLPLRTIIALTWRLKLARLFLWLARVTDTYDGVVMRIVRRIAGGADGV